jgi:signal transduction histidine kinase/PAS domain-containing protein
MDKPSRFRREALVEQILWLIRLRWIAAAGMVTAAVVANYVFTYPVLVSPVPIYICAAVLLLSNILYFALATKKTSEAGSKDTVLAMVQLEADLIILTAVLHFSGGVVNPFFLFFIFHILIATIILPRNLSFCVGLTAILLYGFLAANEVSGGMWFGNYSLRLAVTGGLWGNPVYVLGGFVAFVFMVVLAQYLTRIIIVRMTANELQAARNSDVLKAVISAMSEGLIFVNCDGRIAICNPAARLWKNSCGAKDAVKRPADVDDLLDHNSDRFEDFPSILAEHMKSLCGDDCETAETEQMIYFDTGGDQPRYIEAISCCVTGIGGEKLGYVIVGQDLTEHKKLEKELLERTEDITAINEMLKMSRVQMAQREKMVAIGQMAADIAHEIGNPLASLSSVAQYLGRSLKTHEEKEHLLVIESQVSRISQILKRMLNLARPCTSEYKWTDINEVIDETLSLLKFDKRMAAVAIKNVADYDLPMVWMNPQLFEQVLLNIFINALDAMNAGDGEQKPVLEITTEFKNGKITTRVSDNGIGMSPEVCRRAFESFFTTKEIGKGTGLGLFISYNLITEIDGTISLESEPGRGTTVIITIPVRPKKDLIVSSNEQNDFSGNYRIAKEDN